MKLWLPVGEWLPAGEYVGINNYSRTSTELAVEEHKLRTLRVMVNELGSCLAEILCLRIGFDRVDDVRDAELSAIRTAMRV